MKKIMLFVLITLSTAAQADPFNIYLPFKTQYAPGALEQMEFAFVADIEAKRENFQVQIAPITDSEQFIETGMGDDAFDMTRLSLGMSIGLGNGFEFEMGIMENTGRSSLKYDFNLDGSSWMHSIILGYSKSESYGHGGAILPDDSCDFFDFGCWLFEDSFYIFGGPDDAYEFDYLAEIKAVSFGYIQGYQYTTRTTMFWSVYHAEYDIDVSVTDNTGGSNNQASNLKTNLMALSAGARWKLGKKEDNYNKSAIVNYVIYKDSTLHDGDLNGELKLSYVIGF